MSPTQTASSPAGASASTSVGSSDQVVTPTVSPVSGSTAKTRPVSPESLVVTSRSPATTSPLDSMICGSSKRHTTSPSGVDPAAVPMANGTASAAPASADQALPKADQLREPRPDRPGVDQVVVLLANAAALDHRPGPHRP